MYEADVVVVDTLCIANGSVVVTVCVAVVVVVDTLKVVWWLQSV